MQLFLIVKGPTFLRLKGNSEDLNEFQLSNYMQYSYLGNAMSIDVIIKFSLQNIQWLL